jgi:GNAT superfamily N-acetyltransferase
MNILPPELLTEHHQVDSFVSGVESMDLWLKQRAFKNQMNGASRVFVACEQLRVIAYYALASGAIDVEQAPGRFRRNMPDPIPVIVLGRLAVDQAFQGKGIGRALIRDAGYRIIQAADTVGIRGIIAQAISENAKAFYEQVGFSPSPLDPMTLMITLNDLKASI